MPLRKRKFEDCEMTLPFKRSRLFVALKAFARFRSVRDRKYPILRDNSSRSFVLDVFIEEGDFPNAF